VVKLNKLYEAKNQGFRASNRRAMIMENKMGAAQGARYGNRTAKIVDSANRKEVPVRELPRSI